MRTVSLESVAARLSARAPGVATAIRTSQWKVRNLPRSFRFEPNEALCDREVLAELIAHGIAVRPFDAVFRDRSALDDLLAVAEESDAASASPTKDFLTRLMPRTVTLTGPYVRLALEPQVVALANAYLGMRSYLRALDVWLNVPTNGPPKLSQLWHRDYDDLVNLKLFVYLGDVDERSGPFVFAPGTQPGGLRTIDVSRRMNDDEMAAYVPRDEWIVCSGEAGTVVIADTCGFHKGGKPEIGRRVLWTAQFTSIAAAAERNFELAGNGWVDALSDEQLAALYMKPRRRR